MIPAIIQNLQRGINLLNSIDNQQYSNNSTPPYHSSIGVHMRHILDVFDCILRGLEEGEVDLSARKRNELAESQVSVGIDYFEDVISRLSQLSENDLTQMISVQDDLGGGVVKADYSLAAVLIQAHSHAIHHFASIGYIISQLCLDLPDVDFGYNPTTPRSKVIGGQ